MNSETVEAMLQNWARYVRGRKVQGHCASIEHRFNWKKRPDDTPTGWGDWHWSDKNRIAYEAPVDALQAIEVERTMRHLPDGHRKALRLAYVDRMPRKMVCLRLVIAYRDYDRYLDDARCMVSALWTRYRGYGKRQTTIHQTSITSA